MTVESVSGTSDIHLVDTHFLDHEDHNGVYVIDDERTAIVETGASPGVEHILRALEELEIDPREVEYLAPTHIHLDHAGGAGYLLDSCSNARVICHSMGIRFLSDPEYAERLVSSAHDALGELAEGYGDLKPIPEDRFIPVEGGERFDLGEHELETIAAPGHAPHQVCFFDHAEGILFPADEAGMWIKGNLCLTTPPPNFDLERSLESLDNLLTYRPEGLLFPHFGLRRDAEQSLREYKRMLRDWTTTVERHWTREQDREKVIETMIRNESPLYEVWDDAVAREFIRTNTMGTIHYLQSRDE